MCLYGLVCVHKVAPPQFIRLFVIGKQDQAKQAVHYTSPQLSRYIWGYYVHTFGML